MKKASWRTSRPRRAEERQVDCADQQNGAASCTTQAWLPFVDAYRTFLMKTDDFQAFETIPNATFPII